MLAVLLLVVGLILLVLRVAVLDVCVGKLTMVLLVDVVIMLLLDVVLCVMLVE